MPNCRHCAAEFSPKKPWGKFCSHRCGNNFRMKAYRIRKAQTKGEPSKSQTSTAP